MDNAHPQVFDYLLSLELEVSLVWPSKWSLSKILFFCARYPPFIDVPLVLGYELTSKIDIHYCFPLYASSSWGLSSALRQQRVIAFTTIIVLSLFLKSLKCCHLVDGSIILVVAFILVLLGETVISAGNMAVLIWAPLELVDLFNTVLSTRIVLHVRAVHREDIRNGRTSRDISELSLCQYETECAKDLSMRREKCSPGTVVNERGFKTVVLRFDLTSCSEALGDWNISHPKAGVLASS
ncbi:hypothetical protein B0H13DRAFT_1851672 [Mycena leptocephala]|nr:hypothetical protein B0H13DRAFT_1851672 [Mycena leptocephala]